MATNLRPASEVASKFLHPVKIVNPTFLPTDPPKPIETAYVAPRMSDGALSQKREKGAVWRVTEVELEEVAPWLMVSFKMRWPRCNENGVMSWIRAAISSPTTCLVRSPQVVGAAVALTSPWEPLPIVEEVFTRYREPTEDERNGREPWKYPGDEFIAVYEAMRAWATDIGAREMRFVKDTNARVSQLDKDIPDAKKRSFFVFPIEP